MSRRGRTSSRRSINDRKHENSRLYQSPAGEDIDANDDDNMSILSILGIVLPLLLVYISNQWSRSSLYYLVDFSQSASSSATPFTAMNLDIGFDQAQYGLLASLAFTALFAITSLFAGTLADKYDRKNLTIGATLAWSLATFYTASSTSYENILAARIFMGLACAFATPSAYTFLADTISKKKISLANSIYGSGVYFGGGLSSLSILVDQQFGWRVTCGAIGGFGVVAAILALLLLPSDPKTQTQTQELAAAAATTTTTVPVEQEQEQTTSSTSTIDDVLQIASNPRLRWLFLGSFARFCSGLTIGVWAASYYKLAFPDDASSYAVINAFIVGLCGVSSGLIGGWAADKTTAALGSSSSSSSSSTGSDSKTSSMLPELDTNAARLLVPITGSLLAIPAWWSTCHADTFDAAMTWLAIEYLVAECWFGPTVAVLQSEVQKGKGGIAQGLFTLTGALGNLAPSIIGVLYGQMMMASQVDGGSGSGGVGGDALSDLLGIGVCAGYFISAICFGISAATKPLPDDKNMKVA